MRNEHGADTSSTPGFSWPILLALTVFELWAAHALVFFAHEYAHSITAWLLGWKSNPLSLHFPHPSPTVWLMQLGIDQNVDEVPIFAAGQGAQAAVISAAGAVLGNALITLPLSRWGYRFAQRRGARAGAMFCFWVCIASLGNLWDYVPIRTFTDGTDLYQDMFAVEQGLHWSPWLLLTLFGAPTLILLFWFLFRVEPASLRWLFPHAPGQRVFVAVLAALFLFGFYGAAGLLGGGPISFKLALVSTCLIAPLAAVLSSLSVVRTGGAALANLGR